MIIFVVRLIFKRLPGVWQLPSINDQTLRITEYNIFIREIISIINFTTKLQT